MRTLSCAAWPFCPFLGFANNLLECKGDAFRLLKNHRRPVPRRPKANRPIGGWDVCLHAEVVIAASIASLLFCFSTGQLEVRPYHAMPCHDTARHTIIVAVAAQKPM